LLQGTLAVDLGSNSSSSSSSSTARHHLQSRSHTLLTCIDLYPVLSLPSSHCQGIEQGSPYAPPAEDTLEASHKDPERPVIAKMVSTTHLQLMQGESKRFEATKTRGCAYTMEVGVRLDELLEGVLDLLDQVTHRACALTDVWQHYIRHNGMRIVGCCSTASSIAAAQAARLARHRMSCDQNVLDPTHPCTVASRWQRHVRKCMRMIGCCQQHRTMMACNDAKLAPPDEAQYVLRKPLPLERHHHQQTWHISLTCATPRTECALYEGAP
jgi:hypothetical protein